MHDVHHHVHPPAIYPAQEPSRVQGSRGPGSRGGGPGSRVQGPGVQAARTQAGDGLEGGEGCCCSCGRGVGVEGGGRRARRGGGLCADCPEPVASDGGGGWGGRGG
eukprot:CAMPEP_0174718384 /NCGR_PEP_ID=MMETSP1094-20130205/28780_1 /TAXON_ID=156173 /ORGANISM="Chrysochromulina brevifilum, Strain UTEX LB 985" /LENGTH=105 /DNA_ID=CAMNT_0015918473 /DNA_START=39 /DNA_END=353 /DNA_ORIENTATION=-